MNKTLRGLFLSLLAVFLMVQPTFAAQITRQHADTIINGNIINASDLSDEFNSLVTESNGQDNRLTGLESGTLTISGSKTYSGTSTFIGTSLFQTSVNLARASDPGSPTNGDVWYNSTSGLFKFKSSSGTSVLQPIPKLISGAPPVYASAATLTLANFAVTDSTGAILISKDSSTTVDITTSGLNGLDTGSEASNTWYYLYAITDGTTPGLILSTINESVTGNITLPAGYTYKRQLPFAVRNDGSSNFIPFYCMTWGTLRPTVRIDLPRSYYTNTTTISTGGSNVLANGTATSNTAVTCSSFVPPISRVISISWISNLVGAALGYVQETGTSHIIPLSTWGTAGIDVGGIIPNMGVNSSQQFDYRVMPASAPSAGYYIDIYEYTVTEIN